LSQTVGRKWPRSAPKGDYQAICGYCGAIWRRSQLVRDMGGILVCPDEAEGLDENELTLLNAAMNEPWERSEHDANGFPLSTDVAPDLSTLLNVPSGESKP
jgi:hypothetical protein